MVVSKLPNYLRAYRRRAGLSQDEVAFLLGHLSGAHLSRYEHFRRTPTLATALAFEAVFQVPAKDLFAGHYQQVERAVARRAGFLARRLSNLPPGRQTARKLEALRKIIASPENP